MSVDKPRFDAEPESSQIRTFDELKQIAGSVVKWTVDGKTWKYGLVPQAGSDKWYGAPGRSVFIEVAVSPEEGHTREQLLEEDFESWGFYMEQADITEAAGLHFKTLPDD